MKPALPSDLARALRGFFADYLPRVRGASPHTVRSYRDAMTLLLRFLSARGERAVVDLELRDLTPDEILAFLEHLVLLCHKVILPQGDRTTGSEEGKSQEFAPGAISGSQWKRGYGAQAVGDPRGRKSLGTLAGRRKARGAGGESRARSAARNA